MDKYHYVLNALLDELDFLRREQLAALDRDADYAYASWLQTAQFVTNTRFRYVRSIFQESQPGRYHLPESSATGAFDKYLDKLLKKSIAEFRLVFEKERPRYKERHIEFIKFSLDEYTLNCTLVHFIDTARSLGSSDPAYDWWQKKRLEDIGWQVDNSNIEQYSIQFSLKEKSIKQQVKEYIARTVFETLHLHEKTTKLVVKT